VGVGTVVSTEHVSRAHDLGATFTVAPGLDPKVIEACFTLGVTHVPGVATPSEIQLALSLGISTLKLFPAGALGMEYLAALRGPFDKVRFVPTGAVSLVSAPRWLASGAFAVGLGGALTSGEIRPDSEDSNLLKVLIANHLSGSQL